ncbi:MAG: hypothetical protein FWE56_00465 [Candidatus Bathyarchaeota archaeon]|nr:hypothetical protein [Candidatus Termiticorpusculum sp.]MCL2867937.1 hypothetical protein [Candidatus Termiticorpusculum sp.]
MHTNIGILDFCYENSLITVVANRNFAEVKLAGLNVGPFDEGNEYQVYYWIAKELQAVGVVHLREEEVLDGSKLYKVQWKEGIQVPGMISELPQDFYPKLRRFLVFAEAEAVQPEKIQEYHKVKALARDIINSRLKKIIALSSASAQSDQILKKLTTEERVIYEQLGELISAWKNQILQKHEKH